MSQLRLDDELRMILRWKSAGVGCTVRGGALTGLSV